MGFPLCVHRASPLWVILKIFLFFPLWPDQIAYCLLALSIWFKIFWMPRVKTQRRHLGSHPEADVQHSFSQDPPVIFFYKYNWGPLALKHKNTISSNNADFFWIFRFTLLVKVLRFYIAILPYSVLRISKCFLQVGKIWIIRSRRRNNL